MTSMFVQANTAYKNGNYDRAVKLYKRLVAGGISNGTLFYNLGNAYFKKGEIGRALLNYRKAEIFIPRDEDLQANIHYTLQLTKDKIESEEFLTFLKSFCFWYAKLNINELLIVFLTVNFLFWTSWILKILLKKEFFAFYIYIFLFFTVLFGFSFGIKMYCFYFNHNGVVIAKEINVRSGNSLNNTILFQLHEGAEFKWEKQNNGWVRIRLRDGKRGWVQADTVEKVTVS